MQSHFKSFLDLFSSLILLTLLKVIQGYFCYFYIVILLITLKSVLFIATYGETIDNVGVFKSLNREKIEKTQLIQVTSMEKGRQFTDLSYVNIVTIFEKNEMSKKSRNNLYKIYGPSEVLNTKEIGKLIKKKKQENF